MIQRKNFNRIIKEKEIMWERTKSYWKYIATFCFLQFLDMFLAEDGFQWTPFLSIEMIVLGVIGGTLLAMYFYYFWQCKFKNREVQYAKVLKDYFVDSNLQEYSNYGITWKKIMTLMSHPEMSHVRKAENVFWGWGDDGTLTVCPEDASCVEWQNGFSLKVRPWTCTEQKNVKLMVKAPVIDAEMSWEDFKKQFDICMKKEQILYNNQLYIYPLFLDENGRAIRLQADVIQPLLLSKEHLNQENDIDAIVFEKCVEQLQRQSGYNENAWKPMRYGIVSLFQQVMLEEAKLPWIGLLAFVQLRNETVKQLEEQQLVEAYYKDEAEVVKFLLDDFQDELVQYALLMYTYTKLKRYDFVELFLQEFLRGEKQRKRITSLRKEAEKIYNGNAKEGLVSKSKLWIRRALYNLSDFIVSSPWKKILFLLIFALENIIEPFTVGSAKVSLNVQSIWNALVLENVETIVLLAMVGLLWLLLLFLFSRESIKNWLNPGQRMLQNLTTTKKEKYVQIGKNTNLFWAYDLVVGWNEEKVSICVARDDYETAKELLKYENERIINETNDGTKFRMISVSEDVENEKIMILVDRCKYTETMRVQEMLRRYHANGAHQADYKCFRDALLNLKERSNVIRLEEIPPNSLCMHAVILTKDDYVLLTTRSENLAYYPGAYDCSAEEQLHKDDFDLDGVRIQNWVERFLEEELGLTKENCASSSLGTIRLLSVFIEEDALNIALVVKIRLNTSKAELEAILDNWPRKDYEFKYQLVNWEAIVEQFEKAQRGELQKGFHPTAVNRMYLVACSEMRFDMAERIYRAAGKER